MFSKVFNFFGPRILKTGLGVTLALVICELLRIETAAFAAITVVINMLPSFNNALRNASNLIKIHLLSIPLAIGLGFLLGTDFWMIGIIVVLFIGVANKLKLGAITQGVVAIIFILDAPPEQFLQHAAIRSVSIIIGLAIALLINRILAPPHYKEKFKESLQTLFINTSDFFFDSIQHFVDSSSMLEYKKAEPNELKEELTKVRKLRELARGEFTEEDNALVVERLMEVCRGFIERGENIEEMTRQRVKRRHADYSPLESKDEPSAEFSVVLRITGEGKEILKELREDVSECLRKKGKVQSVTWLKTLDLDYWSEFDQAMEQWYGTVSGVFYLRAMMEIAVVATELRWSSKRMKSIVQIASSKDSDS